MSGLRMEITMQQADDVSLAVYENLLTLKGHRGPKKLVFPEGAWHF